MSARADRRTIVCPCHDVTLHDLKVCWKRGYTHPETLKRATALFMGPCQGKLCAPALDEFLESVGAAPAAGDSPARPTVRPPLYAVRLGELADPDAEPA
ncbi:(2Fe-2S)-binding protein [Mumia sp. ZJ1417]|nr:MULTISPECIES: (2Fe-2S)-binding protein [unclassified Mumia]QMW65384.1 (2Fe-2S)-binding protein [Mumia sp. ZJ1417]